MSGTNLAAAGGAAVVPVVWTVLGYQFEAGPMIASLFACVMVRAYRGTRGARYSARLDLPVSILTLIVTAGCIIHFRPEPLFAIAYGMGIGTLGEALITMAEKWVSRTGIFGPNDRAPYPEDMNELIRKFDEDKEPKE